MKSQPPMGIGIKSLHRKARLSKTSLVCPEPVFRTTPRPHPRSGGGAGQGRLDRWSDDMRRMRDEFGAIQQNVVRGAKEGEGPYALPVVGPMRHAVDTVGTGPGRPMEHSGGTPQGARRTR